MYTSIHLQKVKQGYYEHFFDAIYYCGISLKASFYFFIHSLFPDLFEFDGSNTIKQLNNILEKKKQKISNKIL